VTGQDENQHVNFQINDDQDNIACTDTGLPRFKRRKIEVKPDYYVPENPVEEASGTKRRSLYSGSTGPIIDRLNTELHQDPVLPASDRFRGDPLSGRTGRAIILIVKILAVLGFLLLGYYLWTHEPLTFMLYVIILLLVFGVVKAGLEFGENSVFNWNSHFYHFWR
jgi:hypothetical protein